MSDVLIQLPQVVAPFGVSLDGELLTVAAQNVVRQRIQLAFKGEGAGDIAEGGASPLAIGALGLGVRSILSRSAVQSFVGAPVVFNNVTTQNLSSLQFDCSPYRWIVLYLDATKAGNPAALNVSLELSDDGGTDFFQFLGEGSPIRIQDLGTWKRAYRLPCPGRLVRTRLDAEGTTAGDTITVNALTAELHA